MNDSEAKGTPLIRFDHNWVELMQSLFPKGTQIQCNRTEDKIPALSGELGTVECIDNAGVFHCTLEDGRTLVAAIDEGCFRVNRLEQTEIPDQEKCQLFKELCGVRSRQRTAILAMINPEQLTGWAADILFPPLRSILALPGEAPKAVRVNALEQNIRRQLNADRLNCVQGCAKETVNLYFDPDALKKGLPFNRQLDGRNYYGPILINGAYAEGRSLTDLEMIRLIQHLNHPSVLVQKPIVSEVNKDTFWTLIAEAKVHSGQDLEGSIDWLVCQLLLMEPQQSLNFDNILRGYSNLAYKYGLWTAASVMLDGCTDDGFIDFRCWLIAQGKEVYLAALKDPDTLADVPLYGGGSFESLSYIGSNVYETQTGRDAFDGVDRPAYEKLESALAKDIVYGEGIDYPYKWNETADYLPRLCEKYLTQEDLAIMIQYHNDTWNLTSPSVRRARETAVKGSKNKKNRGDSR